MRRGLLTGFYSEHASQAFLGAHLYQVPIANPTKQGSLVELFSELSVDRIFGALGGRRSTFVLTSPIPGKISELFRLTLELSGKQITPPP